MSSSNKVDRFEIRVNPEEKATVERAAMLSGLTVSAYMRSSVLQKARTDINQLENLVLSDRDRDQFLNALETATPSTGKLKQAFANFRQKYPQS
jgi:uncharacterized protein (DUF1778 family)